jgi:hypothetical protein
MLRIKLQMVRALVQAAKVGEEGRSRGQCQGKEGEEQGPAGEGIMCRIIRRMLHMEQGLLVVEG